MNRRMMLLVIGSLLLTLGCGGDDPAGPAATFDPLVIGTVSLPNAAPTVAYSVTLAATGGEGSYTWSVFSGGLPLGLSLTAGAITGTPNAVSIRTLIVQVTSGDGQTTTQALMLTVAGPPFCSSQPASAIPTFENATLAAAIRAALSVGAQDDLTCGLVSGLTVLDASFLDITSMAGVENLTNLTSLDLSASTALSAVQPFLITDISPLSGFTSLTFLDLSGNGVSDISALSALTNLTSLNLGHRRAVGSFIGGGLQGPPSISDISPLSGLTNLTFLQVGWSIITDISALSSLTSLTDLLLEGNISDISPLSGLTSLTFLDLGFNSITDISPLSGLTGLRSLDLLRNVDLSDIQPLLNNTGLGANDNVGLADTRVSCGDVAALEAKGVLVQEGRYNGGWTLEESCL